MSDLGSFARKLVKIVTTVLAVTTPLSALIGPALAAAMNLQHPQLLEARHMSFTMASIALGAGFWVVATGVALYAAASGFPLAASVPRKFRGPHATWEPARGALYLSLPISLLVFIGFCAVIFAVGVPTKSPIYGAAIFCYLAANALVSTIVYVRNNGDMRGAGLFAFRAFASATMWVFVAILIEEFVFGLWGNHRIRTPYSSTSVTVPIVVTAMLILAMTIASISAAHQRLNGIVLGVFVMFGLVVAVAPGAFLNIIERVAGLR